MATKKVLERKEEGKRPPLTMKKFKDSKLDDKVDMAEIKKVNSAKKARKK